MSSGIAALKGLDEVEARQGLIGLLAKSSPSPACSFLSLEYIEVSRSLQGNCGAPAIWGNRRAPVSAQTSQSLRAPRHRADRDKPARVHLALDA